MTMTAEQKLLNAIFLGLLEKTVDEYNELVKDEYAIDLYSDVLADLNEPYQAAEIKKKYAEVASAVIAIKVKERMTKK